jgi:hypothetical protein
MEWVALLILLVLLIIFAPHVLGALGIVLGAILLAVLGFFAGWGFIAYVLIANEWNPIGAIALGFIGAICRARRLVVWAMERRNTST